MSSEPCKYCGGSGRVRVTSNIKGEVEYRRCPHCGWANQKDEERETKNFPMTPHCSFEGCKAEREYYLSHKCKFCGMKFCPDHLLPENHKCEWMKEIIEAHKLTAPIPSYLEPESHEKINRRAEIPKPRKQYPRKTRRSSMLRPLKKIVMLSLILFVFLGAFAPDLLNNNAPSAVKPQVQRITGSLGEVKEKVLAFNFTSSSTSKPPVTSAPTAPSSITLPDAAKTAEQYLHEELRNYALQLINEDREKHGLAPVVLGDNKAAQLHAEDMLEHRFLSHWGSDGSKPYMRYSRQGGRGGVAENAAFSGFFYHEPNAAILEPKEEIRKHQYGMMYDDADSDWGHRDNILDKYHNKVNIGIAYDSTHLAYVQDFEDDYISWSQPITYSDGTLTLAGKTTIGTVQTVALYYDPLPQPLTQSRLLDSAHGGAYSLGDEAGYILEPPYYIQETKYVHASRWSVNSAGNFSISANIQPLLYKGAGVYTVVIWVSDGNEDVPLTTHSLFIS